MGNVNVTRTSGGVDVTRRNGRGALYLTTGEPSVEASDPDSPDGTIRFLQTPGEDRPHLEQKKDGVFNDSSMRFSPRSIELGRNLILEGAAHYLKTENSEGTDTHALALLPHIDFSDTGSGFTHAPVLNTVQDFVFFTNPISQKFSVVIDQFYSITFAQIVQLIIYRTGTVAATDPIEHSIYQGTDNTGLLINRVNLPTRFFFAETPINSVSDSGGNARFNFTVGPTPVVGDFLSITDYVTNTDYNVAGTVSVTGSGFFELTGVLFGTNESGGNFSGAIVDLASDFGFSEEQVDIFIEMKSASGFSLQTNAGGNIITIFRTQELKELTLIMDELVLNTALDIVIDNNLNFVTHNRFP